MKKYLFPKTTYFSFASFIAAAVFIVLAFTNYLRFAGLFSVLVIDLHLLIATPVVLMNLSKFKGKEGWKNFVKIFSPELLIIALFAGMTILDRIGLI